LRFTIAFRFIGGETTTISFDAAPSFLGLLTERHHGVSGRVFALGHRRLRIEDLRYDGDGPDAFFWVGTAGEGPSAEAQETGRTSLLPHPFTGAFYEYADPEAPQLGVFTGQTVTLTLPPDIDVDDLKWISVWCRRFNVNFGELVIKGELNRKVHIYLYINSKDSDCRHFSRSVEFSSHKLFITLLFFANQKRLPKNE
jgi:hypothetical protein